MPSRLPIRRARLRFSAERARWVASEQWHPQQDGKFEAGGSYLLRIPFAGHRELIMDFLEHGVHCEVLGPAGASSGGGGRGRADGAEIFLKAGGRVIW